MLRPLESAAEQVRSVRCTCLGKTFERTASPMAAQGVVTSLVAKEARPVAWLRTLGPAVEHGRGHPIGQPWSVEEAPGEKRRGACGRLRGTHGLGGRSSRSHERGEK